MVAALNLRSLSAKQREIIQQYIDTLEPSSKPQDPEGDKPFFKSVFDKLRGMNEEQNKDKADGEDPPKKEASA